jgi:hypothetical protein
MAQAADPGAVVALAGERLAADGWHAIDREAYTEAETAFIAGALA